jgi:hypothetical protein
VTSRPPSDPPPTLLTVVYADEPAGQHSDMARVEDGRLHVVATTPQRPGGHHISPRSLRDVILDAQVSLLTTAPGDAAGVYLRQEHEGRFVTWTVTHDQRCRIGLVDGGYLPVIDAPLPEDIPFHMDRPNRMTVVAMGPSLTFVLNLKVVTGTTVDQRWQEGFAGILVNAGTEQPAEAAVDWVQVRAVIPGQPDG